MTKSIFETERAKAERLYGPRSDGKILNTAFVSDRVDVPAEAPNDDSAYGRAKERAAELYGPKPDGKIANPTFVHERK